MNIDVRRRLSSGLAVFLVLGSAIAAAAHAPLVAASVATAPADPSATLAGVETPAPVTPAAGQQQGNAYLPLVTYGAAAGLAAIVPPTTRTLSGAAAGALAGATADMSVLTFIQALAPSFSPGNVIVSAPSTVAPDGLLRKVVAVSTAGGNTVVQTEAAALEEALQQGEVHVSQALSPANLRNVRLRQGVSSPRRSLGAAGSVFHLDINNVILYDRDGSLDTTNDQVVASGSVEMESTLAFDLRIKAWQLEQTTFTLSSREQANIHIESAVTLASVVKEYELARYDLKPIVVMVGRAPVVLTPILTFVVGVDGAVSASVAVGVTQQATIRNGVHYADGQWASVNQHSNEFGFSPPTVPAGGELKGYTGPRLQVLLYGVEGPQINIDGYARLEANLLATPWWKVYGGLEASAEFRTAILSHGIADYKVPDLMDLKEQLAQATDQPPTPTPTMSPTPPPGSDTVAEIPIPAGAFQMGCDSNNPAETCQWSEEQPLHTVTLDAYSIDQYAVTNGRYQACVAAGGCTAPQRADSWEHPSYYGNATYVDYPVITVNWFQAEAFCAWAGKRLPTEAEWEKAARGSGDTRKYPWGDSDPDCTKLNYAPKAGGCVGDTSRVGSYPNGAGPYGVMDMAGNVWEWVNDWYQADYYSGSPASSPQGPATGARRVLRGGSWTNYINNVRVAARYFNLPELWFGNVGFRCARSP